MLIKNQYPPSFSEPIIHQTLTKIFQSKSETTEDANDDDSSENDGNNVDNSLETVDNDTPVNSNGVEEKDKFRFFVQYRGKSTGTLCCGYDFEKTENRDALKPPVKDVMRSGVIDQIDKIMLLS